MPAAALVGTNKLPWEALGNVRELYLCLDLDVTGEGQKAARKLAREAVLRGVPVHIMRTAPTADIPSLPISGRPRAALPWTGPPKREQELRRWMDHTADPEAFARWLEWAMNYTDPVEGLPCPEDTPSG